MKIDPQRKARWADTEKLVGLVEGWPTGSLTRLVASLLALAPKYFSMHVLIREFWQYKCRIVHRPQLGVKVVILGWSSNVFAWEIPCKIEYSQPGTLVGAFVPK